MRRLLPLLVALGLPIAASACEKKVIIEQVPAMSDGDAGHLTGTDGGNGGVVTNDPLNIDLGTISADTDVTFTVPPGALGFHIIIDQGSGHQVDPSHPIGIARLTDPTGAIVLDDFTPKGGTFPTAIGEYDVIAVTAIPQGEGTAPTPGVWKLRTGVGNLVLSKTTFKASVQIQSSGDGRFHGGTIDLHIHVPDGLLVDGARIRGVDGPTNAGLARRVDTFYSIMSQMLQIDRGDVVFHQAPSALAQMANQTEVIAGFAAATGETDGRQELHILFTNEIGDNGKPVAVGLTPAIPGAIVFGRSVTTILVQTSSDPDFDSLAMVHESGHFMGLNHTTEFDGQQGDPLSDTPLCTTMTADPPDVNQMKLCPDNQNIMFPAGPIAGPMTLSPEQIRVYHGSPVYKAYPAGTQRTQALTSAALDVRPRAIVAQFRQSGRPLTPIEAELSLGFCGLNKLDAPGILRRYGLTAVDQLRSIVTDMDLVPVIRGRASLALERLGYAEP
jgi:hypothetical protein